jgi:hypothetical protein
MKTKNAFAIVVIVTILRIGMKRFAWTLEVEAGWSRKTLAEAT